MGFVHEYRVPAQLTGDAGFVGAEAAVAEQMRRQLEQEAFRQQQLAEEQRQFDGRQDYQFAIAELQDRVARQKMGQDAYQFDVSAGLQYGQQELQYDLGLRQDELALQELDQRAQASDNQLQGQMASQMAQTARAREKQNQEMFMADREAILKKRLTPQQFDIARKQLEQAYGIPWGFPEEAMAQEAAQGQEQYLQQVRQAFADPFNPDQTLLPPGTEQIVSQLEPKDMMALAMKAQGEARQRKALESKSSQDQAKAEQTFADIETDNLRADEENKNAAERHRATMEQAAEKAKQDAKIAIWKAKWNAWSKKSTEGIDAGPEPQLDLDDTESDESEFEKMYAKLKPGATYTAPDGTTRIKGGN
jgi:hypothetical protein